MEKSPSVVPKNDILLNKWRLAVPRKDRKLEERDFLCEKYFLTEDIIRYESVIVNGEVNSLPGRPIFSLAARLFFRR